MSVLAEFATPFMGIDRSDKGNDTDPHSVPGSPWFAELYSHSNFDFTGVFLTHSPIAPHTAQDYTDTSGHVSNFWTQSWETLRRQGWGAFFIYAGYTSGEGPHNKRPRPFTPEVATTHGTFHAEQIKIIIAEFLSIYQSDNAGAVVFMDNEYEPLDEELKLYYNAVFEELRKPGPQFKKGVAQPVRPGFYARDTNYNSMPNASEMIDANPDIFVWKIDNPLSASDAPKRGPDGKHLPFPLQVKDMIFLEPKKFPIRSFEGLKVTSGRSVVNLPVGIQGFLNYGPDTDYLRKKKADPNLPVTEDKSFPPMPTRALTPKLRPVLKWDFDMSFVRDPRYPEGSPRIRAFGSIAVKGIYLKSEKRMEVKVFDSLKTFTLESSGVEPDAPLLLADPKTVLTLDVNGTVLISERTKENTWTSLTSLAKLDGNSPLRRLRALTTCALNDDEIQLFFVSRDLRIMAQRRAPQSEWTEPRPMAGDTRPHAFSNLVCSSMNKKSVDVFFLASIAEPTPKPQNGPKGHLHMATWSIFMPNFPGTSHRSLEDEDSPPKLLLGTALAVAAPSMLTQLVFGIGRDLRLWFTAFLQGQGWTALAPVGDPSNDKLFAHSRLATNILSPLVVQVAAISYWGIPVSYTLSYGKTGWALAANGMAKRLFERRKTTANFQMPVMSLRDGELDAREWSINPYGDLSFGKDAQGQPVLIGAGSAPGQVGVLCRRIQRVNEDWFRPVWGAGELLKEASQFP